MEFSTRTIHAGAAVRARHRFADRPDLPDVDVRAGCARRAPRLRLLAHQQPDAGAARSRARGPGRGRSTPPSSPRDWPPRTRSFRPTSSLETRSSSRSTSTAAPTGSSTRSTSRPARDPPDRLRGRAALSRPRSTDRTRLVWVESPTNPRLLVYDIAAICATAHAEGALVVIDNTFATPLFQQPFTLGADLVVHSVTKYLAGHSDLIQGAVLAREPAVFEPVKFLQNATGAVPSPFDCWLTLRGLKTLELRMERHAVNAEAIAVALAGASAREACLLPGPAGSSGTRDRTTADDRVRRHGLVRARWHGRRSGGVRLARAGSSPSARASAASSRCCVTRRA